MRKFIFIVVLSFSIQALAEDRQVKVTIGGAPALNMTVPKEASISVNGTMTKIETKNLWIYLWEVPQAKSVADAVAQVDTIIKGEFIKFKVEETKDLQIAANPAKHLLGKGAEADDGDTGTAEVVIFTDGSHVFAACVHGEDDAATKESARFLSVLKSIKAS